jgi:hypothetical protein
MLGPQQVDSMLKGCQETLGFMKQYVSLPIYAYIFQDISSLPLPFRFVGKILYLLPHARYMPRPSHPP